MVAGGQPAARSCAACRTTFSTRRAAIPHRRRSREGEGARRSDQHHLRDHAEHVRQPLRQRFHAVRPHLSRQPVLRGRLPRDRRTTCATSSCAPTAGAMVPLNALVTVDADRRPRRGRPLQHLPGGARSIGSPAPGYSSGQAIAAMQQVVARDAAGGLHASAGPARPIRSWRRQAPGSLGFVFGLVMVFLILAAQYERWSLPLAVMTAVPFAVFGALRRHLAARPRERRLFPDRPGDPDRPCGEERDPDRRVRRRSATARAARPTRPRMEAARLRFRPIVMTSLAFILGVAAARHQHRRRLGQPPFDRHRRHRRHAGRDLRRHLVRAAVLPAGAPADDRSRKAARNSRNSNGE